MLPLKNIGKLEVNIDLKRNLIIHTDPLNCWLIKDKPNKIGNDDIKAEISKITNKKIKISSEKIGNPIWDGLIRDFPDFLKDDNGKDLEFDYESLVDEIVDAKDTDAHIKVESLKKDIRSTPKVSNWKDNIKIKIFDKIFAKLKYEISAQLVARPIEGSRFLNDIVDNESIDPQSSDGTYKFSLVESNRKFRKLLEENNPNKKEDEVFEVSHINIENQNDEKFETTMDVWKEFDYFNREEMLNDISLRQKWVIVDDSLKNEPITELSNVQDELIFNSKDEAEQWAARKRKTFLRKKYDIYLLDNAEPISIWRDSEEEAMEFIRNSMIKIDYTYIHKDLAAELSKIYDFKTRFPSWDEINTTGLFTIYGYKLKSTGQYLYYKSYDEAYKSYIADSSITTDIVETTKNVYYYQYTKLMNGGNKKINRKCEHNNTIDSINKCALEVYKVTKENEKNMPIKKLNS